MCPRFCWGGRSGARTFGWPPGAYKDPFRELIPKAGEGKAGESKSKIGESKSKTGESKAGEDFIDQSFPGVPDFRDGGAGDGGADSGQGVDRGGSGNLFDSGGDLGLLKP